MSFELICLRASASKISLNSEAFRFIVPQLSQKIPCGSTLQLAFVTSEHQSVESMNGYQQKPLKGMPRGSSKSSSVSHCSTMYLSQLMRSSTKPLIFVSESITGR